MNYSNENKDRREFLGDCGKMTGVAALASVINLSTLGSVAAQTTSHNGDFRAIVNVLLNGGADSFSFIAPADEEQFQRYKDLRRSVAFPREGFTEVASEKDGNFLINNKMADVINMYNAGDLSFVAGVGTLITPINAETNFRGRTPGALGSHSDQLNTWQTSIPQRNKGSLSGTGWIGRLTEILHETHNSDQLFTSNIALGSAKSLVGRNTIPLKVGMNGPNVLNAYNFAKPKALMDLDLEHQYGAILHNHMNALRKKTIDARKTLQQLVKSVKINTAFPDTNLGNQLKQVAKYIKVHKAMGANRQTFTVEDGKYDNHSGTKSKIGAKMPQISQALNAFNKAMKEIGLHDNVLTFISSDFGRMLTPNGSGTNHGWAGNSLVMGGAVQPNRCIGKYPDLTPGAAIFRRTSRPLPQIGTDQFFGALAYWFGVDNDANMELMLPNIRNFKSATGVTPYEPFLGLVTRESLVGRHG